MQTHKSSDYKVKYFLSITYKWLFLEYYFYLS